MSFQLDKLIISIGSTALSSIWPNFRQIARPKVKKNNQPPRTASKFYLDNSYRQDKMVIKLSYELSGSAHYNSNLSINII